MLAQAYSNFQSALYIENPISWIFWVWYHFWASVLCSQDLGQDQYKGFGRILKGSQTVNRHKKFNQQFPCSQIFMRLVFNFKNFKYLMLNYFTLINNAQFWLYYWLTFVTRHKFNKAARPAGLRRLASNLIDVYWKRKYTMKSWAIWPNELWGNNTYEQ